ncbi:MAG: hypothetical protein R3F59_12295 [Myxococcota bacterium]
MSRTGLGTLFALVLAACNGPDGTGADSGTATGLCADAPVVTYANFGKGFVTQHCQSCHASTTPDRHGAPDAVAFDDEASCWQYADRILARATGPEPDRPPQGGVDDDDRYLLEVWLTCGG